MSVLLSKQQLRKELKLQLGQVTEAQQESLRDHLKKWFMSKTGIWTAFAGLPGEPQLLPLLKELRHIDWVFPKVRGSELDFFQADPADLKAGAFGILEPTGASPKQDLDQVQGFLVPGLGFDRSGLRLGRGLGFYDRALQGRSGFKLGVGFECLWLKKCPAEEHDQKLDAVMTEAGLWTADRGK